MFVIYNFLVLCGFSGIGSLFSHQLRHLVGWEAKLQDHYTFRGQHAMLFTCWWILCYILCRCVVGWGWILLKSDDMPNYVNSSQKYVILLAGGKNEPNCF